MSAALFLVAALPASDDLTLDGAEGHHAATVQRVRVGEEILLGDGRGGLARAVVTGVGKGSLTLRVLSRSVEPAGQPRLVVVQGIAKGDRGELAVQAMTEVGVDVVVPWAAGRSVAKWSSERPHQRWVDTAREAAKQSRRAWLPLVEPPTSTEAVARRLSAAAAAIVLHEEGSVAFSAVPLPAAGEVVLVVGPEGGITPEELAAFAGAGATVARLGAAVLRTSTAGPAALAVLNARLDRW